MCLTITWCGQRGEAQVKSVAPDVTSLLKKLADGNDQAAGELIPIVYEELHRLAVSHLRRERRDHTLQPTAPLHEAYIKLVAPRDAHRPDRDHFFSVAPQPMLPHLAASAPPP